METQQIPEETQIIEEAQIPAPETNEQENALSEKDSEINALKKELEESSQRLFSAGIALSETELKLALLLAGVAKEKLSEAVSLTSVLCKSGKSPAEAASEIVKAYPHLKAVQREIPQFSAGSSGVNDGFSAVRRIFSGK